MSYVIAGATTGLLMASVFVGVGPIMLFSLARDPSPFMRAMLERVSPMPLMIALVILAYPTWGLVGAALGLVYRASTVEAPGGGLGSPNLLYTVSVVAGALVMALPIAFLLRRVAVGVAALTLIFAGLFGWLLPFFAR